MDIVWDFKNTIMKKLPSKSFLGYKTIKYRIVDDSYHGYECQVWRWWWPFWAQMNFRNGINTFNTLKDAIDFVENVHSGNFQNKIIYAKS